MASRLNHERVNRAAKVAEWDRDRTPFRVPTSARTGFTCDGCGLDLAHFGSRFRFNAHRASCAPAVTA